MSKKQLIELLSNSKTSNKFTVIEDDSTAVLLFEGKTVYASCHEDFHSGHEEVFFNGQKISKSWKSPFELYARILSYRYDKEYFDFITSNNLLEKIPNKIMSTTIDGVKRNVHFISTNSKFKLNKPIIEINNLSNDLFLFFVNNKMCHDLVSFVIKNKKLDEETINKMFEYGITLNYVKDLINKGYNIKENHLLSAINYCNIDVFKFIYEELKIKPDWSLIEKVSLSGRINILDYCVEKGYITIEDLDVSFHQYDISLLPGHMSPRSIYHLEKKLNEKDKSIIEECINQKIISIDNNQIEPLVQKMTRYRLSNYKTSLIDKDKMIDYLLTLTK